MTQETEVWASTSLNDTEIQRAILIDLWVDDEENGAQISRKSTWGEVVTSEEAPKVFTEDPEGEKRPFPDFFFNSGFIGVSEAFRNVAQDFDMGGGLFHPIDMIRRDGTHMDGKYYCWTIGNKRQFLLPELADPEYVEKSSMTYASVAWAKEAGYTGDPFTYEIRLDSSGHVPVSAEALTGPAAWVDPLSNAFFMHGSFVDALRQAGVATRLELHKCKIIFPH